MDSPSLTRLSAFLVEAKRRTYAGLDDNATVSAQIFPGSKQLEYRERDLSYRDIYFGMAYFVGQEVVQAGERVIWSMSYAGGVSPGVTERSEFLAIYAFLRKSLLSCSGGQAVSRTQAVRRRRASIRKCTRRGYLRISRRGADIPGGSEGLSPAV